MNFSPEISENNTYEETCKTIRTLGKLRVNGGYQRVVFTNGCFDVLHAGHMKVLRKCREIAGPFGGVVVGINSDVSVKRLKGESRPIFPEEHRGLLLASLRFVDHVVSFDEDTPIDLIRALQPDVIVKGGDYKPQDVVGHELSLVTIVPLEEGWSTTSIIERMKR